MSKRGFTIIELTGATAIIIILIGCFYASLNSIRSLERMYWNETRAVVVLNNVIERVRAEPAADKDRVASILTHEFDLSGLAANSSLSAQCTTTNNNIALRIVTARGSSLASVEVPQ